MWVDLELNDLESQILFMKEGKVLKVKMIQKEGTVQRPAATTNFERF